MRILLSYYLMLIYVAAFNPFANGADLNYYRELLARSGLQADAEGASGFLLALSEGGPQNGKLARLVEELGSADFPTREAAMAALMKDPAFPAELVRRASKGGNAEAAWRAQRLMDARLPDTRNLLFAVLKAVQLGGYKGLGRAVLSVVPLCDQRHLLESAQLALKASVEPGDRAMLLAALRHEESGVRRAAITGLGGILKGEVPEELLQALEDGEDEVKLAAATVLANQGDPRCLAPLIRMLESENPVVRSRSVTALRSVSGQYFNYAAYGKPEDRTRIAGLWQAWLEQSGGSGLKPLVDARKDHPGFLGGSTVVAMCNEHRVVAFDATGKETWEYPCRFPYDVKTLPNGNLLIPVRNSSKIIEVNQAKEVVWEVTQQLACHAQPLDGGNLLICGERSKRVLEINRKKQIQWSHEGNEIINAAYRLEDGNTLLKSNYKIDIVNPKGESVWKHVMHGHYIYSVQPLRNGNLLICLENKVFELTPDHREVHEIKVPGKVFNAWRLPDGNTLVTGPRYFAELTPDSELLYKRAIESSWSKIIR